MLKYVLGGILVVFSARNGYHLVKNGLLYRTLSGNEPGSVGAAVDGDRIAVEGRVSVDETAPASELAVPDSSQPVGMYVWRVAKSDTGSNRIDFRNMEIKGDKDTVGAGIETGTLEVSSGGTAVRIDPTWIREAHDAPNLTDFTVVPGMDYRNFHLFLWRSPYVHLAGEETEVPLDRLEAVIEKYDAETSLADMWLQSRPAEAGDTLTVYGEVRSTDETLVIRGTDETPLFITNDGLDGLNRNLLRMMVGSTAKTGFFLALAVIIVFYLNW